VEERNSPSNQQFTREELEFIGMEAYASICNGATDPLFEAIYAKSRALSARSAVETTDEWKCLNCGWTDEPPTVCAKCSGPMSPVEPTPRLRTGVAALVDETYVPVRNPPL
jgi:hypothetical protein